MYPLTARGGRLASIRGEGAAIAQILGLCRDLVPGDFVAFPSLGNPCDLTRRFDVENLAFELDELAERVQGLFSGLGRRDIRVQGFREGESSALLIQGGRDISRFRVRIPVRVESERVVLAADEYEELS